MLMSCGVFESENSTPVTVRTPDAESETTIEPNTQVSVADRQTAVNGLIGTKPLIPMTTVVLAPEGADDGDTYETVARRSFLKRMGNVATHVGQMDSFAFAYRSENDKIF
jgi:hypothetical protein